MQTQHLLIETPTRFGPRKIALSVHSPNSGVPSTVIFASPGGGYGRGYYNICWRGDDSYSQALYHTERGCLVIAYDHLCVGDSDTEDLTAATLDDIADANAAMVRIVSERLQQGDLAPGLPKLGAFKRIGIGQSLGGCLTIIMQGTHAPFDAIAPLGYSAIHTQLPQPDERAHRASVEGHALTRDTTPSAISIEASSRTIADFIYPFHFEDVPRPLIEADMSGGYPLRRECPEWGSRTVPPCAVTAMSEGAVAPEAAKITCPVFIGVGARDVCPRPHEEPRAYSASNDITLAIIPSMAHMHNFASSREELWRRLHDWAMGV